MAMVDERRRHPRVAVAATLHCRRLALAGFDDDVAACDLSVGGAQLLADHRLGVGDFVVLDVDTGDLALSLRGLVVAVRAVDGGAPEDRYVHVAFTGLSEERVQQLGQLIDECEPEPV
jgi:hypothetical protein